MKKSIPTKVAKVLEYKPPSIDYKTQKSVSFSQFSQYSTCKHQWALNYVHSLQEYSPSIHTVFGTAFHETVQSWLQVLYNKTIKKAEELDLDQILLEQMRSVYKKEKGNINNKDFTTADEMKEFYQDGRAILKHLASKRGLYFSKKGVYLAGIEVPLVVELRENVYFKGFIDIVLYDQDLDKFTLIDLKTSTRGWNSYQKKDEIKTSQLLLYKHFFSQTFEVPLSNIDVEFMVVRRKLNEDLEFVPKRVQRVSPASGKIKMGKITSLLNEFVQNVFDEQGSYIDKAYTPNPSKSTCMFCPFKKNKNLCKVSVS